MFAGIDVASETHMLARLDAAGAPIGKPVPISEDQAGCKRGKTPGEILDRRSS